MRTSVVCFGNRPESVLPSSVPDLKFDFLPIDFDMLGLEINANRSHKRFLKLVIGITQKKTAFTNGAFANNQDLKESFCRRHLFI